VQRYFFHMASKAQQLLDDKGREIDSLSAAHEYAISLIYKAGACLVPEDLDGWRINVTNIAGRVELVVLFPRNYISHNWRRFASGSSSQHGEEKGAPAQRNDRSTPIIVRLR
jgi:Domain of unknown function (DUF6894)